jgi:hypothetical protein
MLSIKKTHLVKVGLEEVHLLGVLEQAGPELNLEVLLLQHKLDGARGVVGLARAGVDLLVELELHVVVGLLGLGVAGEVEVAGLDVELDGFGRDVGDHDREEDVVLLRLGGGRALGPGDCEVECQYFL